MLRDTLIIDRQHKMEKTYSREKKTSCARWQEEIVAIAEGDWMNTAKPKEKWNSLKEDSYPDGIHIKIIIKYIFRFT